jgi:hypothetical protein
MCYIFFEQKFQKPLKLNENEKNFLFFRIFLQFKPYEGSN